MNKDKYIKLLSTNSRLESHELIEECLIAYNKKGTCELTIEELRNFCIRKKLISG